MVGRTDRETTMLRTATTVIHNDAPVYAADVAGWFYVCDFAGRYVQQQAATPEQAVERFVAGHTANMDTGVAEYAAWRAAGYPSRTEYDALKAAGKLDMRAWTR